MRKLRKYLVTSLSLGLAGVTVAAVVASCAGNNDATQPATSQQQPPDNSATPTNPSSGNTTQQQPPVTPVVNNNPENSGTSPAQPATTPTQQTQSGTNPNPASANSLVTSNVDFLQSSQIDFNSARASQVKKTIEDTKKGIVENNRVLESAIGNIKSTLNNNSVFKNFFNSIGTSNTSKAVYDGLNKIASDFKQKNLLPNVTELDTDGIKRAEKTFTDPNTDAIADDALGLFAAFYLDPASISELAYYNNLIKALKVTDKSITATIEPKYEVLTDVFELGKLLKGPAEGADENTATNGYRIWNMYANIAAEIKTHSNPDPNSDDSFVKQSNEALDQKQIQFNNDRITKIKKELQADIALDGPIIDNLLKDSSSQEYKSKLQTTMTSFTVEIMRDLNKNAMLKEFLNASSSDYQAMYDALRKLGTDFKQKNLLPTAAELDVAGIKTAEGTIVDPNSSSIAEDAIGIFAAFYLDPTSISRLAYFNNLINSVSVTLNVTFNISNQFKVLTSVFKLGNLLTKDQIITKKEDSTDKNDDSTGSQAWKLYNEIANLVFVPNPDPISDDSLVTNSNESLTNNQIKFIQLKDQKANEEFKKFKDHLNTMLKKEPTSDDVDNVEGEIAKFILLDSPLKQLFTNVSTSDGNYQAMYDVLRKLGTDFKQKNLLPTAAELDLAGIKTAEGTITDPNSSSIAEDAIGIFAAFYLDPLYVSKIAYLLTAAEKYPPITQEETKTNADTTETKPSTDDSTVSKEDEDKPKEEKNSYSALDFGSEVDTVDKANSTSAQTTSTSKHLNYDWSMIQKPEYQILASVFKLAKLLTSEVTKEGSDAKVTSTAYQVWHTYYGDLVKEVESFPTPSKEQPTQDSAAVDTAKPTEDSAATDTTQPTTEDSSTTVTDAQPVEPVAKEEASAEATS